MCVCVCVKYGQMEVVTDELVATKEAIETAYSICCSAYDSQAELLTRIATLFECVRSVGHRTNNHTVCVYVAAVQ